MEVAKEETMKARVFNIEQYRTGRRPSKTRGSAGFWSGDNLPQIRLRMIFVGTNTLLVKQIAGFESDRPGIIEPVLSMCLRAAAYRAGPLLGKYVPKKHTGDFLPFLMVEKSKLRYRRYRVIKIPAFGKGGDNGGEAVGHHMAYRVTDWRVEAEIVIAHFPGVDEQGMMTLFAKAGTEIGLGALRPREGGKFGTFKLDKLEVVSGSWPEPIERLRRGDERKVDVGEQIDAVRADLNADDLEAEVE